MLSYVCDRCRKIIPSTETRKMVRLQFQNDSADRNIDLCSKCFGLFDEFILNDEQDDTDNPVEMSLTEDGFECPRCFTLYNFPVTDKDRRIHILRTGSHKVEEGYIDRPFVNFNCTVCNLLLAIPKVVLEEVNNGY